ncbi:MAG: glycosyltransferase family 4 protein [Gammaproteobacteria bacterium]
MRIAFYSPLKPPTHPAPSGDRRLARLLMAAFEHADHEVLLASTFRSFDGSGNAERQQRLRRVGNHLAARLVRGFRALPAVRRPDVWFTYHIYHKAPDWLGPVVSAALDVPYVIAECSFAPKQQAGPWSSGHAAARHAILRADAVIALNTADVPAIKTLRGDEPALVSPFLDIAPYAQVANRETVRQELASRYALNTNSSWLLTVAMMRRGDKLASFRLLAQSLREIQHLDWQLIIAGDGEARADVMRAFSSFASDRVMFTGRLEQESIIRLAQTADIFVWPAFNEAFGMAMLEAQAAGLPVIAGNAGGVSGVVAHRTTGLLVEAGDARGFASATQSLLEDSSRRARMGAAARQKTREQHDVASASGKLSEILEQACCTPL